MKSDHSWPAIPSEHTTPLQIMEFNLKHSGENISTSQPTRLTANPNDQFLPSNLPRFHLLKPLRDPPFQPPIHKPMSHALDLPTLQQPSKLFQILARNSMVSRRRGIVFEQEPKRLNAHPGSARVLRARRLTTSKSDASIPFPAPYSSRSTHQPSPPWAPVPSSSPAAASSQSDSPHPSTPRTTPCSTPRSGNQSPSSRSSPAP